ncbi:MAG TPA: hypothetical protein VKK31_13555 [Thermoanaerobaculia bacterium]|nr:hypothetical protein [Thermoanaerobaculia bacterium]
MGSSPGGRCRRAAFFVLEARETYSGAALAVLRARDTRKMKITALK